MIMLIHLCISVFTVPAVLFVDNLGRKKMLFFGATGMAICHAIVAGIIARAGPDFENKAAGNAAVVFLYMFIAIFAVTWGRSWFLVER